MLSHHELSEQEILMPNASANLFENNEYTNPFLNRSQTTSNYSNSKKQGMRHLSPGMNK